MKMLGVGSSKSLMLTVGHTTVTVVKVILGLRYTFKERALAPKNESSSVRFVINGL